MRFPVFSAFIALAWELNGKEPEDQTQKFMRDSPALISKL
jgi:hypothetical protein